MRRREQVSSVVAVLVVVWGAGCGSNKTATTGGTGGTGGATSSTGSTTASTGSTSTTSSTGPGTTTSTSGGTGGAGSTSSTGTGTGTGTATGSACTTSPCLNVINNCPFPLWIHAAANAGTVLTPDDAEITPTGVKQYALPASWPAARVNAYWEDPTNPSSDPNAFDKVELTFTGGVMNYDITYVDYLALPAQVEAVDPACPKTGTFDPSVACTVPVGSVLDNCPAGLADGKRCLSANLFCSQAANQGSAYCHALDSTLATCESQQPATCGIAQQLGNGTPDVYGCSGYFDSQPPTGCTTPSTTCHIDGNEWCAALNRGMLANPTSTDVTAYYQTPPYNTYAKWVHDTCPGIYAFAYDDYPSTAGQGGFRSCTAARLDVTFCPGG